MTPIERIELKKQGINVLRPMYNHYKNYWCIVKATINGGWARCEDFAFNTKDEAQQTINDLVAQYPNAYRSDN